MDKQATNITDGLYPAASRQYGIYPDYPNLVFGSTTPEQIEAGLNVPEDEEWPWMCDDDLEE